MKTGHVVSASTVVLLATAWQILPSLLGVSPLILPQLTDVSAALWDARAAIAGHGIVTALATLAAMLAGLLLATIITPLAATSRLADAALTPIIVAGQALPKIVLIPLLFLSMNSVTAPGIIVGALIAFFPIYVSLRYSIDTIPRGLLDLAKVWRYSQRRIVISIGLPYALPAAIGTLKLAWIYAMIGVVSAELLHPVKGLGFLMDQAYGRLDGAHFYASVVACLALALCGWSIASAIDRRTRIIWRVSLPVPPLSHRQTVEWHS